LTRTERNGSAQLLEANRETAISGLHLPESHRPLHPPSLRSAEFSASQGQS
jgi:hypothetical protein